MNNFVQDIKSKLDSISFFPGFTLTPDEALFYVIITELRLLCKIPLVIIERIIQSKDKVCVEEFHTNGTQSEYIIARFLINETGINSTDGEYDFSFKDNYISKLKNKRETIRLYLQNKLKITDAENGTPSIIRYRIQEMIYNRIDCLAKNLKPKLDNLDESIINKLLRDNILRDILGKKGVLIPILQTVFGISDHMEVLKRFWHYDKNIRKFYLMNFFVNIGLLLADISLIFENEYLDKIIKLVVKERNGWRITFLLNSESTSLKKNQWKNIFDIILKHTETNKDSVVPLSMLFTKQLSHIVKYRKFVISETLLEQKSTNSSSTLAKAFSSSIYFKVFDEVASKVLDQFKRLESIKKYRFDFTFFLIDKSYQFTWYLPSKKIETLKINLNDDLDARFFSYTRDFSWHKLPQEQGFSEYVTNTAYPQFFCNFFLIEDFSHRMMRFKKKTWLELLKFFRLIDNYQDCFDKTHCVQIPIVFSLIPFAREHKHLTERYDLWGVYPIYNFNFNVKADEKDPYLFFRTAFDFSFECMFIMSYLQKNQEDFLKSQLFENATDSLKKALKFPLSE